MRISLARAAQVSVCAAIGAAAIAIACGIRGIVSESMPRGLYYTRAFHGHAQPGDTVEVCLPSRISRLALRRGYLARGILCDDGVQRVVKSVLAVAGDTVDVTPDGLWIRGHLLPNTRARSRDSLGRRLLRVPDGRYAVQPGTLWLFSTEVETSFDSRYFGAVPEAAVRRRFHPLWTEAHRSTQPATNRR